MRQQVLTSRAIWAESLRWRDVVGRNRIAEQCEAARTVDVGKWLWIKPHALEVRRTLNVGRVIPCVVLPSRELERLPALVAREGGRVARGEAVGLYCFARDLQDRLGTWPEVAKEDWISVCV